MPRSRRRLAAATALLLAVASGATAASALPPAGSLVGLTLAEAIGLLQRDGLPVVFSSAVVTPAMRVREAPAQTEPRAILDELLAPHGLGVAVGPRGRLVVVRAAARAAPAPPAVSPRVAAEILVTASAAESRHGEPVAVTDLPMVAAESDLPHPGNDPLRGVGLLPGASGGASSAQLSVRGGRSDGVLVLLDGLELLGPYHLQEFDSALGVVSTASLERVELIADPVPVEYGDRLGGVVDMRTRTPDRPLTFSLELGSLFAEATAAGSYVGDRGRYLVTARSGNYRLALEAAGREDDPRFWDLFGKADHELRPGQSLQLRLLFAGDDFDVDAAAVGGGTYRSRWRSSQAWLGHVGGIGDAGLVESTVWGGGVERTRFARDAAQDATRFDLDDDRLLEFTGGKSVSRWSPPDERWSLEGGAEWRHFRSATRYRAARLGPAGGLPGAPPEPVASRFAGDFDFEQAAAFASARGKAGRGLTVEAGLRWEHTGLTDESHVSPRVHLAWAPDRAGMARAAWGWYYQSQRPYELQVEDGATAFWPAERSTQGSLSYERRLGSGASWRLGAWERRESRPRPRFESLFDAAVLYPEIAPGRVRLAPSDGRARGLELSYRAAPRPRLDWTAAYTWSAVEDRLDGRWLPRASDEPHALELQAHLRLSRRWTLSGAWLYHTGWPTTRVEAVLVDDGAGGSRPSPALGPIRGERLPDYHRLDLRLGGAWDLRGGRLGGYLDLQNVYDRDNVRGFEAFRLDLADEGAPRVLATPVSWGGFQPSFGVRWTF
jgi:hypothetical protein